MSSVTTRKRGKGYEFRFDIAKVNGKRKQYTKSGFKTRNEAYREGCKAFSEYNNTGRIFKVSELSYSDYLDYWIDNYCKNNLRYNTIQSYKSIIRLYIKPKLGSYRLSAIDSSTLDKFIVSIVKEHNFSRAYCKSILKVIKGTFNDACNRYGYIKYNPAITLRLPRDDNYDEEVKHIYTVEEVNIILEKFKDDDVFTLAFIVARLTGMRTCEIFALTWEDIDFNNNVINVNYSVHDEPKDNKGRWYLGLPKTKKGKRKIVMNESLKSALMNYKNKQDMLKEVYGDSYIYYHFEECINKYGKVLNVKRIVRNNYKSNSVANLIFTKSNGEYVGTDVLRYPYKIIREELGINGRFYDNRGTFATMLSEEGANIFVIKELLGHVGNDTIDRHYIKCSYNMKLEVMNIGEKILVTDVMNNVIQYNY